METKKTAKRIFIISSGFLILIIVIAHFTISSNYSKEPNCSIPAPQGFCISPKLTENEAKGKKTFNEFCAACHKLKIKSTGPSLAKVDSIVYRKWIVDQNEEIDTSKISNFQIDYHRDLSKKVLNSSDVKNIFEYIKHK